ncbi:MAG TPA: methyltransferase domain-containing protein [Acetobacteraceae bacterium]|jgi:SAM-dependent methyltransferase|nr:methyltransferase domain-containing protein [Acetobacteraceae bacterium]
MPPYPDHPNTDLLERIPLGAAVVLDVGCGTGPLGAAYRRFNPRARLLGIDSDPAAAALAAQRLDEVAVVDVEENPLPFELDRPIDCIIYGDVLEHLRDPWPVLRRHIAALSEDGTILICVPNVEHWSFADRLLRGTWDYEPSGLLDDTHLRWFSLETMRKGLLALGLTLCDVHARIFDAADAEAFTARIAPALTALGVDPQAYAQRAAPLQYVWRVRKHPHELLTVVANMLQPVGGVSHVRVVYPLQALNSDPTVVTRLLAGGDIVKGGGDGPRIFVLHRPALTGERGAATIRALLSDGWLIVTEFDDHPDHFGMLHADDQFAFSGVHAVQTSTPALAAILRTRNPEVAVFPNAVRALPDVRNFLDPKVLTVFFGALNREPDWAALMPALNAVAEKAGDRLRFCVLHDRAFFDALKTPHKMFTPTCDYDAYMALLGQCEISFMPLGDTPFNRAKSDLKFIEAGACRVAALASHVVYADSIEEGRTGLLFRSADELHERLLRLVAMPELARGLGNAARSYVAGERMLAYQVAQRIAWYRSLWARRVELTNALHARMTEPARLADGPVEP